MKVLIKDNANNLVWKDAVYKNGVFLSPDGNTSFDERNIYSVKDDDRNKIVVCSACGQEMPNNPSAIRVHRNMINKPNKCFECRHLRPTDTTVTSQKFVLNEDGTYTESTKRNVKLTCYRSYRYYDINSLDAKHLCKYAACENAEFRPVSDFWVKYPNAFDELITIDRIIDDGYKSIDKYDSNIVIELQGRARLTAYINNQGLCYGVSLKHRSYCYMLRYSKKYDKVWVVDRTFRELNTLDISESTEETIRKKLRSLYE